MASTSADYVIIGAGPAGLSAAAIFARNEKRVLLIDQYQIPVASIGDISMVRNFQVRILTF